MSVSLTDRDVAFLDRYAKSHDIRSRSEVIRRGIWLLFESELQKEYEAEYSEAPEPDWYDLNPNWADEYPSVDWAQDEDE